MNYVVTERNDSREMSSGKNASATLRYLIEGTVSATAWAGGTTYAAGNVVKRSDGSSTEEYISLAGTNLNHDPLASPSWWQKWSDSGALTALLAAAPATHSGLVKISGHVNALCVLAVPDSNPTLVLRWEGEVIYAPWDFTPPAVGEERYEFETGGGTQHITQSIETIASYAPAGKTAPDHKGAIGVGTDNAVEGCDIESPSKASRPTPRHTLAGSSSSPSRSSRPRSALHGRAAFARCRSLSLTPATSMPTWPRPTWPSSPAARRGPHIYYGRKPAPAPSGRRCGLARVRGEAMP